MENFNYEVQDCLNCGKEHAVNEHEVYRDDLGSFLVC